MFGYSITQLSPCSDRGDISPSICQVIDVIQVMLVSMRLFTEWPDYPYSGLFVLSPLFLLISLLREVREQQQATKCVIRSAVKGFEPSTVRLEHNDVDLLTVTGLLTTQFKRLMSTWIASSSSTIKRDCNEAYSFYMSCVIRVSGFYFGMFPMECDSVSRCYDDFFTLIIRLVMCWQRFFMKLGGDYSNVFGDRVLLKKSWKRLTNFDAPVTRPCERSSA